jgi:FMN phosphatase YigB (HAD superfamily)
MSKFLEYKNKYFISKQKNLLIGGMETSCSGHTTDDNWLVLDVDECLYDATYINDKIGEKRKYVDDFIKIHKDYALQFLEQINMKIASEQIVDDNGNQITNFETDIVFINYLKSLNRGGNSIIGLFKLLKRLQIPFSMTDYHNTMYKKFRYDKIEKNENIKIAIAYAKQSGMKIGIFSNGSYPHIMKCLNRLELNLDLFDYISCIDFIADTVSEDHKPYSFEKFQNEIQAKPENIYFFDDSDKNCFGAKRAGWNVFFVNTSKKINERNTEIVQYGITISSTGNLEDINKIHCIENIDLLLQYIIEIINPHRNK